MFRGFLRRPAITIFHRASSPQSVRALELLRKAQSSPYPPTNNKAGSLEFDLEVVETQLPTPEQLETITQYLPRPSGTHPDYSALLSAHPSGTFELTTPSQVLDVVKRSPNALRWPIVVDWWGGRASAGDLDGVKNILEGLRRQRDGEADS